MKRIITMTIILLLVNCNPPGRLTAPRDSQVILEKVNRLRIQHGLLQLRYLHTTQSATDAWSKSLEKNFRHARRGYSCENIAYNFNGPEMLFEQWLNSPPHKRNMLLRGIRYCTISVYVGSHKEIYPTFYGVFRGYDGDFVKSKKH